ncbi:MAG: hypothetical protein KatS3mg101_1187 [Patescibacteria group bacterium]|nr:MAG: hypothetical protein KatS3mg089_0062 [Patescibacteria group bacterium]GIW70440.1 MAG: hypothetical protein KatS3mg101_1187 [Patescibacteria group bacterium]
MKFTEIDLNTIYLALSIFLAILNIYQFFKNRSDVKILDGILTMLHNTSESLRNALLQISQNPDSFTDKKDVINTVGAVSQLASGMVQAIEEQRFYSSKKEAKQMRTKKQEEFQKKMSRILKRYKQ